MFNLFKKQPAANQPTAADKQPSFPFDLTGRACFSVIDCPVEQAVSLLTEYPTICAMKNPVPYSFQIAALPEDLQWTLLRWPRPGRFYDLMNLTVWLMGYQAGLGGETPIFIALPPQGREAAGPLLARLDYDNPFGDSVLGYWQGWSFAYSMPEERLRWIGRDALSQEAFLQGRDRRGFRLEWLKGLERLEGWRECPIDLEG